MLISMTSKKWVWCAGAFGAFSSAVAGLWWAMRLRAQRDTIRQALLEPARADHPERGVPRPWIIVNPSKFSEDELADFKTRINRVAHEFGVSHVHWRDTSVEDPGTGQARHALSEGASIVIAAGGDGTVRAVAAALAGSGIRMGVLPQGTGNLFARNVGIPVDDPEEALRIALGEGHRHVDLCWLRTEEHSEEEKTKEEPFLVIAGIGFDGRTMADTDSDLKKSMGWAAYVVAALGAMDEERMDAQITLHDARSVDEQRTVTWSALDDHHAGVIAGTSKPSDSLNDDTSETLPHAAGEDRTTTQTHAVDGDSGAAGSASSTPAEEVAELKARSILFANCGQLPLVTLAPDATIDDGLIDVIAADTQAGAVGWANLAGKIFAQGLGLKALNLPLSTSGLSFRQATAVRVHVDSPRTVQVDGDALGESCTVHVRVQPDALDMSVPMI